MWSWLLILMLLGTCLAFLLFFEHCVCKRRAAREWQSQILSYLDINFFSSNRDLLAAKTGISELPHSNQFRAHMPVNITLNTASLLGITVFFVVTSTLSRSHVPLSLTTFHVPLSFESKRESPCSLYSCWTRPTLWSHRWKNCVFHEFSIKLRLQLD